jgi:hypothetical protein
MTAKGPMWTAADRVGVGAMVISGTGADAWVGVPGAVPPTRGPTVEVCAMFAPSVLPMLTVRPSGGDHAAKAAVWALRSLGRGFLGGRLWLIADDDPVRDSGICRGECLAVVMAVDDALAGGYRPTGLSGNGLVERLLRDPVHLCGLVAAAGLAVS